MSSQKTKISFDLSPAEPARAALTKAQELQAPELAFDQVTDARTFFQAEPETKQSDTSSNFYAKESLFDREEWEKNLVAPKPVAQSTPFSESSRVPKKVVETVPRAPGFAATGLMATREPGFAQRHAMMIGVASGVVATLVLVIVTAFMLLDPNGSAPEQMVVAPAYVPETFSEAPTRTIISDMTDVSEVTSSAAMSDPVTSTEGTGLGAAVLAAVQPTVVPLPPLQTSEPERVKQTLEVLSKNKLRMLREGILAGIYDVETYKRDGVERVKLRTHNAPLINMASSGLLLEAVARGEIELSASLFTTDGEVDVETMMFNLVQISLINDHDVSHSDAALDMSRKIFAASNARTQTIDGERFYTVQTGDSLAYIALQFYGRPSAFKRILDANRNTLQSPDEIQIGQRLIIPS